MSQVEAYGIFTWFPENGNSHIHPEDFEYFSATHPAGKVFEYYGSAGDYIIIGYGGMRFRVKPELFKLVKNVKFYVGDTACVVGSIPVKCGCVVDVNWHFKKQMPIYYLSFSGKKSSRRYYEDELNDLAA